MIPKFETFKIEFIKYITWLNIHVKKDHADGYPKYIARNESANRTGQAVKLCNAWWEMQRENHLMRTHGK